MTHYPEEILPIFDRCLVLRRGRLIKKGELTEIMTTEQLTEILEADVTVTYLQDGRLDLRVK